MILCGYIIRITCIFFRPNLLMIITWIHTYKDEEIEQTLCVYLVNDSNGQKKSRIKAKIKSKSQTPNPFFYTKTHESKPSLEPNCFRIGKERTRVRNGYSVTNLKACEVATERGMSSIIRSKGRTCKSLHLR